MKDIGATGTGTNAILKEPCAGLGTCHGGPAYGHDRFRERAFACSSSRSDRKREQQACDSTQNYHALDPGIETFRNAHKLRLASTSEEIATKSKRPMQARIPSRTVRIIALRRSNLEVESDLQLSYCPLCQLGRKDCTEERSRVRPAYCRQNPRLVLGPGLPACRIFERGATRHALNRVATIKPWRENVFETRFERQMMKKRSGVNRKICKGECNHVR
jgi:hypothetical protein